MSEIIFTAVIFMVITTMALIHLDNENQKDLCIEYGIMNNLPTVYLKASENCVFKNEDSSITIVNEDKWDD